MPANLVTVLADDCLHVAPHEQQRIVVFTPFEGRENLLVLSQRPAHASIERPEEASSSDKRFENLRVDTGVRCAEKHLMK